MAPYTVRLFGPNDQVVAEEVRWFEHGDHALDEVGRSNRPHSIRVRQGEQTVAYAPAWPPKELLWEGEAAP